jgi:hypothetical protein
LQYASADKRRDTFGIHCRLHSSGDAPGAVPSHYELVRELELENFPALDAVVIIGDLCEALTQRSYLPHMCYLFAALLFLSLKDWAESQLDLPVTVIDGPLRQQAGTYRGIALVDIQLGRLLIDPVRREEYRTAMSKPGDIHTDTQWIINTVQADMGAASELAVSVWAVTSVAEFHVPAAKAEIESQCERIRPKQEDKDVPSPPVGWPAGLPSIRIKSLFERSIKGSIAPHIYKSVAGLMQDRATNLANLCITRVSHYRSEAAMRELVVLSCQHTSGLPESTHYWVIERFRSYPKVELFARPGRLPHERWYAVVEAIADGVLF